MRSLFFALSLAALALVAAASPALAQVSTPPPKESPIAGQCRQLIENDKRFHAEAKNMLRLEIHEEDADLTLRNRRHVVLAYAALWILAVAFLTLMFLRQRSLLAEIARLRREVSRATVEEEE